ncbi:hypothetical protein CRUP_038507 [Coryphaenoides rupestris]|nr:hypothetical protein CRUP_038507 [Coryphaenoides rupestris]
MFLKQTSDLERGNVVLRVSRLPLVSSTLQTVTSVYSGVKGRYPLLGLVGDVAEEGVRSASLGALSRATPLLQSLDTQMEVANNYACFGLDQLEKNFSVLHQSSEEVMGHLKDAFFLTLDDMKLRGLESVERPLELVWDQFRALQNSHMGLEWERQVQQYEEEEDDGDEPGLWTRFRSLLLSLSLQLYHRMLKQRDNLNQILWRLEDGANKVGLGRVVDTMGFLLHQQQLFQTALLLRAEALRDLALMQVKGQTAMLAELSVVRQLRGLPAQLQQPSDQDVEDFLNQERFTTEIPSHRDSAKSLFLKAMDGRPRRRKSLYSRARQGSGSPQAPNVASPGLANGGDQEPQDHPSSTPYRRPSATELLLTPIMQLVSQSQKAFENLSPTPDAADEDASLRAEIAEN